VYALNLPLSPEKNGTWESADPVVVGAGDTGIAPGTSGSWHPGVPDSIELDNADEVTRRASEDPKVLGEASRIDGIVAECGLPT
jgi:hypothetical protein